MGLLEAAKKLPPDVSKMGRGHWFSKISKKRQTEVEELAKAYEAGELNKQFPSMVKICRWLSEELEKSEQITVKPKTIEHWLRERREK